MSEKILRDLAVMVVVVFTITLAHIAAWGVSFLTPEAVDPWHMLICMTLALVIDYNAFNK